MWGGTVIHLLLLTFYCMWRIHIPIVGNGCKCLAYSLLLLLSPNDQWEHENFWEIVSSNRTFPRSNRIETFLFFPDGKRLQTWNWKTLLLNKWNTSRGNNNYLPTYLLAHSVVSATKLFSAVNYELTKPCILMWFIIRIETIGIHWVVVQMLVTYFRILIWPSESDQIYSVKFAHLKCWIFRIS